MLKVTVFHECATMLDKASECWICMKKGIEYVTDLLVTLIKEGFVGSVRIQPKPIDDGVDSVDDVGSSPRPSHLQSVSLPCRLIFFKPVVSRSFIRGAGKNGSVKIKKMVLLTD